MSVEPKTIAEKMDHLPPIHRAEVRNFIEYLFEKSKNDPEFLFDLEAACKGAFDRYEQSYYDSWQDLQQAVLLRFWRWLPSYRGKAKRKTVFCKIAINELIDAAKRQNARLRYLEEVASDDPTQQTLPDMPSENINPPDEPPSKASGRSGKKLRQTWAGALRDYREQYSSLELQKKALEWRGD